MKLYLIFAMVFLLSACGFREREEALQKKEAELNQKEQALFLKEKTLQIKETNLHLKEKRIDSTLHEDSIMVNNPALVGQWDVTMNCIETSCPGSAIGDTKKEQWIIQNQGGYILAKAMKGSQLLRVYTGSYANNNLELFDTAAVNSNDPAARITVRLQPLGPATMEGEREIIREGDCKITYNLQLVKK
jgi:hypothetical protein